MTDVSSPVPASMEALVHVFREELKEVEFPDVDLASLEADRARVIDAHQDLERARKVLEVALEDLRVRSTKAHAYALVFAGNDPALVERLNEIPLKRRSKSSSKKKSNKRGETKNGKKGKAPLFEREAEVAGAEGDGAEGDGVERGVELEEAAE